MSIAVACGQCKKSFPVKDEFAGKRGKCPHCGGVIQVPKASPPADDAATRPTAAPAEDEAALAQREQEILGAFGGDIEPVRVSLTYRLGILLVAAAMVTLLGLYVGLIGLVGYFTFSLATSATGMGRFWLLTAVVYLLPMAVGGILVLFMIKPLFFRPGGHYRIRSLTRKSDPLLFTFVDRVCAAVRAPKPRRIDIDCRVNASASFRRGFMSMLGSDFVLTIGLPVAVGLTLRQFAGVLAHEFGHFSQGAGMRLTYTIRTVNGWFTRVVHERDRFDEGLFTVIGDADWQIAAVLYVVCFFIWVTRQILWVLMIASHAICGFMLRQMEFHADRYEARMAGVDQFEAVLRRMALLNVAQQAAVAELQAFHKEGRLGDDLPRFIMANLDELPVDVISKVNQSFDEATTGFLDSHPANKDRIAAAGEENAPGIFHLDRPATVLFYNLEALSRNVTWDFYRAIFGPQFKPSEMHPADDLLARRTREQEAYKSLARYFQGEFNTIRPLPLPRDPPTAPANPQECVKRVEAERKRMIELRPAYDKSFAVYDQADTHTLEADQATAILKADLRIPPKLFSLQLTDSITAAKVRNKAALRQGQATAQLAQFEEAAKLRLFAALELLHVPRVAARIDEAEAKRRQCAKFFPALRALNNVAPALLSLRNEHAALGILLSNLQGNEENKHFLKALWQTMESIHGRLESLHRQFREIPYPLDHAKGKISVSEYMLAEVPLIDDPGAIFDAARSTLDTLTPLYVRLVARLAGVAEEVEKALGLKPLPEPAPEQANPAKET
ncbi:MAG: M48 family metalloprotease [Planctomycetes bacterium]|nr:M48 family metalloprotease [Planctomycetota bacterium]